ncbi:MAG: hypothetical protein AAB737_01235 [Patescibacteria group bacterium]
MPVPVTLHVRTEPYEEEEFDGNKVIGEVKRGDEILYTKEIITDDTIESVCTVKETVGLRIELWAVQNTDFMPA